MDKFDLKISKFMSLVLRHKPEEINAIITDEGYISTDVLIKGINRKFNLNITLKDIERIVVEDDKQRYSFNFDKSKIKANQGHSLKNINLNLKSMEPPKVLYHGTSTNVAANIKRDGICKMKRQYVHLSKDIDTATKVGSRHGDVLIFIVDSERMHNDNYKFYLSENNVWLTDYVSPEYIKEMN